MIHQFDPNPRPDDAYDRGTLAHLVPGNAGRMLDPRRTPIRIVSLAPALGMFECEVLAFEDRGARWSLPFERIGSFQFERDGRRAVAGAIASFEAAIERFDRPLEIPVDARHRDRTLERLAIARREAAAWLEAHSGFVAAGAELDVSTRDGDPRLAADLEAWLRTRRVDGIEEAFAACYVSNPHAGECVKGHRIVLAEIGLAPYSGTIVRDPDLFAGEWSRARRAEHLIARLAFVRELFARCAGGIPTLHRGIATVAAPEVRTGRGFVSATFSREVAESMLGPPGTSRAGVIRSGPAPLERLFMTYLETVAMSRRFREAEAVLIEGEGAAPF